MEAYVEGPDVASEREAGFTLMIQEASIYETNPVDHQGHLIEVLNGSSAAAGYIVFEMFYRVLLLSNNCLDYIADRNDSCQLIVLEHRQMTNVLVSHLFHAVLDVLFGMHVMNS